MSAPVVLTLLTELLTRKPVEQMADVARTRVAVAEATQRNAEAAQAMGMNNALEAKWRGANDEFIAKQQIVSDVAGGFGALSRIVRLVLQSAMLGVGAYLVILQEATAGTIIAGSILSSRALAPVELVIGHWKGFVAARQSWQQLVNMLERIPQQVDLLSLPVPRSSLTVTGVSVTAPGAQRPLIQDISFAIEAGHGLAVIGPSASGKSTLARALVGAWQPMRGRIRLDGADLHQWSPAQLGPHIGYLPQDVELFAGTVAENIARFES